MIPSPPSKQTSNSSSSFIDTLTLTLKEILIKEIKEIQDVELEVSLTRRTQTNNNCGFHVCEFMRKEAQSIVSGKNPIYSRDSYSVDDDKQIREKVFSNMFAGRFLTSEEMKSELQSIQTLLQTEDESSLTTYFQNKVNDLKDVDNQLAIQLESDFLKGSLEKERKIHSYLTTDKMANDLIVERYVSMSNAFLSKNAFFYTPHYSDLFARKVDFQSSPQNEQKGLKKTLKNKSITSHYIPVNIPESHWLLVHVQFHPDPSNDGKEEKRKVKIRVFDSCVNDENYNKKESNLVNILSHFIKTILQLNKVSE
jgi:hypothetical protein